MRGADQRPSPQAGAGERWTTLQCELGYHRLLPVALRQAAPQRDGPHSHTPHTLYLLLMSWLEAVHTGGCTSQSAARWAEAKHITVPGIHTNRLLFGCSGNSCEVLMQRLSEWALLFISGLKYVGHIFSQTSRCGENDHIMPICVCSASI